MPSYEDFIRNDHVSVWLGDFDTEDALDDYLQSPDGFARDFGFSIPSRAVCEAAYESAPVPIADLVRGASRWESFSDSVCHRSAEFGISRATSMLVLYFIAYQPSPVTTSPFRFLGTFPFDGFQ